MSFFGNIMENMKNSASRDKELQDKLKELEKQKKQFEESEALKAAKDSLGKAKVLFVLSLFFFLLLSFRFVGWFFFGPFYFIFQFGVSSALFLDLLWPCLAFSFFLRFLMASFCPPPRLMPKRPPKA